MLLTIYSTEWPILCWCAVTKLLTHTLTTQVKAPHSNPSRAGWYSIHLPCRDGRLSWPDMCQLVSSCGRDTWIMSLCSRCVQATLVCNLSTYGIDPEYFASAVQKGVACSVTVGPRPAKPKEVQVMVQGNQINYIAQLLRGNSSTLHNEVCVDVIFSLQSSAQSTGLWQAANSPSSAAFFT